MLREIKNGENDELYRGMYRPYIDELKSFGGGNGMSLDALEKYLDAAFMKLWAIESDGQDVGFILTEYVSEKNLYRPMLYIAEFYVAPGFRRRGIGSEAFTELLATTSDPVFFVVLNGNTPAEAFWRRQIGVHDLVPVRPDPRQIRFAGNEQLYCFRK